MYLYREDLGLKVLPGKDFEAVGKTNAPAVMYAFSGILRSFLPAMGGLVVLLFGLGFRV